MCHKKCNPACFSQRYNFDFLFLLSSQVIFHSSFWSLLETVYLFCMGVWSVRFMQREFTMFWFALYIVTSLSIAPVFSISSVCVLCWKYLRVGFSASFYASFPVRKWVLVELVNFFQLFCQYQKMSSMKLKYHCKIFCVKEEINWNRGVLLSLFDLLIEQIH